MAPLGRAAGVLCAAFVIAAAIWLGRYSPWALLSEARVKADEAAVWEKEKKVLQTYAEDLKERERQRKIAWQKQKIAWQKQEDLERPESERPKVADKPPFPKLAIDAPIFDMGAMLVDQTTGHKFKIRNVGRAPLIVSRGPAPCKTTPQTFPRRQKVAPGGSIDIQITCTPRESTPCFAKTVRLWTSDPARPDLDLKIYGAVIERDDPDERNWAEDEARHKDRRPKLANKPPFPQVSVDATESALGSVRGGQTVKHKFKITNVGQAPLILYSANRAVKITPLPPDAPNTRAK
jgi:Protein of unknown function (DUF1573)